VDDGLTLFVTFTAFVRVVDGVQTGRQRATLNASSSVPAKPTGKALIVAGSPATVLRTFGRADLTVMRTFGLVLVAAQQFNVARLVLDRKQSCPVDSVYVAEIRVTADDNVSVADLRERIERQTAQSRPNNLQHYTLSSGSVVTVDSAQLRQKLKAAQSRVVRVDPQIIGYFFQGL
jgi:hypothetical protein